MFHSETDELGCANVAVQSYESLGHGRSRGTSFIHLGFVVAEIRGFKIGTFIMEHGVSQLQLFKPFKDETLSVAFKDPVRTAQ